jgi:hypothetical protein
VSTSHDASSDPVAGPPPSESTEPRYLWLKGRAGLGNRILAFCAAVLYARLSGRQLVVDWSDGIYSADRTNTFPHYFSSPRVDPEVRLPEVASMVPAIWQGNRNLSSYEIGRRLAEHSTWDDRDKGSIDLKRLDYQEQIAVMWAYNDQMGLLRRRYRTEFEQLGLGSRDAILRQILTEELHLHPSIQARVEEFKARHFTTRTVGVHVRFSDRRTAFGRLLSSLDALLDREPGLRIFLATDNIRVVEIMEGAYPDVVTTSHWYPRPGERVHDSKLVPDARASGADALVDLYLLAACDYLVIDTLSTFAEVARLVSKATQSNVHDVFRKRDSRRMRGLVWRAMLRSGAFSWGLPLFGAWVKYRRRLRGWARSSRG